MIEQTPTIDEAWVSATADAVSLPIPEERLRGVVATLQNIATMAATVNEVELSPEDELAPTWKP